MQKIFFKDLWILSKDLYYTGWNWPWRWNGHWPDPVGQEVVLTLPKSIIQSYPGGLSPEAASFHIRFDKEDHQIKAKSCQNIKANLSWNEKTFWLVVKMRRISCLQKIKRKITRWLRFECGFSCCSCFHIFCSRYFDGGGSFCFRPEMIKLSRDGSGLLTSHQDHTNAYPHKACECGRQDSWMAYGTLAIVFLYWKIGTGLKNSLLIVEL